MDKENNSSSFEKAREKLEAECQDLVSKLREAHCDGDRVKFKAIISMLYENQEATEALLKEERERRRELSRACPGGGYVGEVESYIAPSDISTKRINFTPAIQEGLIMPGETLTVCLGERTYVKTFTWNTNQHMSCGPLTELLFNAYEGDLAGQIFKIERKPGSLLVISPIIL